MEVYKDIDHLPAFEKAVITIGTFDGVHKGHVQIIDQLIKEAKNVKGTPVLITFSPHPRLVVALDKAPLRLLTTPEEKYALLQSRGIQHIVEVPFTREFSEMPADDYVKEFLVNKFHPHTIIIGYDHRFGNKREGNYQLLEKKGEQLGFGVKEIPEHIIRNVIISSTHIRKALAVGNINEANEYLGYPYFFSGKVVEGNKLGRTIGFPTANLEIMDPHKLIPANGVYAVTVELVENENRRGMMNIGFRPTVKGTKRMIEVNIFDFDETIYGHILKVNLLGKLREEIKFPGLDALKAQLIKDRSAAISLKD